MVLGYWAAPPWGILGSFAPVFWAASPLLLRGFFDGNVYIVVVTIDMLMVTERNDTVIRISKWLDRAVEGYISDRKVKVKFPSKRNFVDTAVMQLLEERGVKLK